MRRTHARIVEFRTGADRIPTGAAPLHTPLSVSHPPGRSARTATQMAVKRREFCGQRRRHAGMQRNPIGLVLLVKYLAEFVCARDQVGPAVWHHRPYLTVPPWQSALKRVEQVRQACTAARGD